MTNATARMTLGALLGTITTSANAISGVVGTVAAGVQIMDTYVGLQLKQQQSSMLLEADDFDERIIERIGQERTLRQLEVVKFTALSENHATLYDENMRNLRKRLNEIRGISSTPSASA